jgi:hypothetical protein
MRRVGGHYATVVALEGDVVVLADPLADRGDTVGGRWVPPDPSRHSCREDPAAHDDAAVLSHDAYVLADAGLPGRPALAGYFTLETEGEAAAFAGQNPADYLSPYNAPWTGGHVEMAIDALLAFSPATTLDPTATPTASLTWTPRATHPAVPATATPTGTEAGLGTASPSASASATRGSAGTESPTTASVARKCYLPLSITRR